MPEVERMMERMLEGLALLTQQVSRLAYAAEAAVLTAQTESAEFKTCRACSSRIQAHAVGHCKACGEFLGNG